MTNTAAKKLAKQLMNIGEISAVKLIKAGINSPEKLKKLGAKEAYLKIWESGGFCGCFNACYLYALEGAILNVHWNKISEVKKQEFKKYTADLRKSLRGA